MSRKHLKSTSPSCQRRPHNRKYSVGHLSLARLEARKAKQLSAQAAEMPGQPARGGPRAGGHNEARVVNEWQSTRSGRDTRPRQRRRCM